MLHRETKGLCVTEIWPRKFEINQSETGVL